MTLEVRELMSQSFRPTCSWPDFMQALRDEHPTLAVFKATYLRTKDFLYLGQCSLSDEPMRYVGTRMSDFMSGREVDVVVLPVAPALSEDGLVTTITLRLVFEKLYVNAVFVPRYGRWFGVVVATQYLPCLLYTSRCV